MVYKFFDKKKLIEQSKKKLCLSKKLAEESHKPIIRKFEKRKVQSRFIDNIWGADFVDMQLISKFNKGTHFLSCVIDISISTHELFHQKIREGLQLLTLFKKSWINLTANQTKYG